MWLDMETPIIQSRSGPRLPRGLRICALFLLLSQIQTTYAAIYKCAAKDGSSTYSDQPCDNKPEVVQVTPDPLHSKSALTTPSLAPAAMTPTRPQGTNTPLSPAIIAAAQDKSARETSASLCSTRAFNEWIKAQGHPLPDPNVRIAKMIEISNQCRRPFGLPDMNPAVPIPAPKLILQGPAGAAAAANLAELVKSGSVERLQKYLSSPGVDINDRPGADEALLDYAAEQNQAPITRFLLEHGARVDAVQNQGRNAGYTALHRAAIADAAEVAELLLAHGAEVNFHGPLSITPLILAASNGSRRTAEVLLNHGADISVPTGHRETALSEATAHNYTGIVRVLLIHLPLPTTASMNAVAMRGDLEALRLMLRHDELVHDVGAPTKDQAIRFTILGPNLFEERKQMIELLLADGADIDNQQPGLDVIPVMLASTPEMAEFLFAHGANKKAKLSGAQLARWFVCNNSGKDPVGTLQVVVAHGIDIGGTTPKGDSALPCAAHANNPALLTFLQEHRVGVPGLNQDARIAATAANSLPVQNAVPQATALSAHERRASETLTLLSKANIQSSPATTPKDRAHLLAHHFLKKLDPTNPNWSESNPKWPAMQALVEKDLFAELSSAPSPAAQNIETLLVHAYAAKMSDTDLNQLSTFLKTPQGARYAAFQIQLDEIYVAGVKSLQANQPRPGGTATDAVQKQRLQLLVLTNSTMIAQAQYDAAKRDNTDISGFGALPFLIEAVATFKGSELDALATRYAADIPAFTSFNQSVTAKNHFAAMAVAQAATVPLLSAEIERAVKSLEANHMAQWQHAYQEQVQSPARESMASNAALRATLPMPKVGTHITECPDCPEMIVLPAGTFDMGSPDDEVGRPDKQNVNVGHSEGPIHRVQVPSFAIGKFEVTRAQFSAFTRETGYGGSKGDWPQPAEFHQESNHPVVNINAADADAYVAWLARKTGQPYHLPTEAEWEYAARANTTTSHYWGNDVDSICQYANVRDQAAKRVNSWPAEWATKCDDGFAYTAPVGSFKPNSFGLYDMLGNAAEAVADCTSLANYVGAPTDASVVWVTKDCDPKSGRVPWHIRRGGSWQFGAADARAAARDATQEARESHSGLRVARSLP
jgi:formylglycine-generating enzyme required for sulfatase activity/ankyrin repeat protein